VRLIRKNWLGVRDDFHNWPSVWRDEFRDTTTTSSTIVAPSRSRSWHSPAHGRARPVHRACFRIASGTPRPSQIRCRLLPRFARSVGFGPVRVPPHTARTEQLSTMARDQSMSPSRASQLRSAKCIRSQMPSCCQSHTRRQQVIPDPQPSSLGSICQGIPLRKTNRIPVRQARSGTRGRPPFGRGGGTGKSGSIRFHNASGSSTAAITRRRYCGQWKASAIRGFCYKL
jgi:hypothetical protein